MYTIYIPDWKQHAYYTEGYGIVTNTVFTLQKLRTVTVLEPFHGTVPVPFTLFVVNQNHACAEKYGRGKNGRGRRSARML